MSPVVERWARGAGARAGRRRHSQALLLSLLIHALLLSLTFGGQGAGLPGLGWPWQDRRAEVPGELRIVLTPAAPARPLVQPEPLPVEERAAALEGEPLAESSGAASQPQGAGASALLRFQPAAAQTADTAETATTAAAKVSEAPAGPTARSTVLALDRPDPAVWAVPAAPVVSPSLPDIVAATPSASSPQLAAAVGVPPVQPLPEAAAAHALVNELAAAQAEIDRTRLEALRLREQQELLQRQLSAQAEAARLALARDEAARVEAERQQQQQALLQEAARKDAAASQDAARQQAVRSEAARQDSERRAEAAKLEAARQESARQEAVRLEAERQELAQRRATALKEAAARQEAARQEAARQEAARQEAARQEAARQEAARQEAARQEAARQEAARQEAARQEAARQEAARAEVSRQAAVQATEAREARLRAIGRQLDEEAARRDSGAVSRQAPLGSLSSTPAGSRRGRLFGRSDTNAELVLYAEAWARKIQLNQTFEMVREVARQPHTDPLVTVAIRSDGSVESVNFVRSSGVPAIDEAIRRVVQSQANYPAFPPTLTREFDVIEIRRSWHFDMAIRLY